MTGWVRLWHDMPTDPKWRVIARKSGRPIAEVIAVFNFAMVNASANASERGRTHNLFADDIAAALDLSEADIQAILDAMKGKVLDRDGRLMGWEKRQPKREDSSADRAREWREKKKAERERTQANAAERSETEVIPLAKANGGEPGKSLFDLGVAALSRQGVAEGQARSFLAQCQRDHGDAAALSALNKSLDATDIRSRMKSILGRAKAQSEYLGV